MRTPAKTDRIDTGQIAEFLRVTRRHVTNRLTKSPDFPRPVIDRGARLRFWLFGDVEEWARGDQRRPAMSSEDAR